MAKHGRMTDRERKAIRELIASGIACFIDIGRAIKNNRLEDREAAVSHADTFIEQIETLTAEEE